MNSKEENNDNIKYVNAIAQNFIKSVSIKTWDHQIDEKFIMYKGNMIKSDSFESDEDAIKRFKRSKKLSKK